MSETTYNGHELRECEVCRAPTTERGNGHANLCHAHDPEAQLGARVVEILRRERKRDPIGHRPDTLCLCRAWDDAEDAARTLGLLDAEVKP